MAILAGKKPVNFIKYQPYTVFRRGGFVFEEGLGNRFRLNSVQLGKLLEARDDHGDRLAYLVVDEKLWESSVAHAHGKKTAEEDKLSALKARQRAARAELERVGKELAAKKQDAQKYVGKDPKKASDLLREAAVLQQKGQTLQSELSRLDQELAKRK